MKKTNSQCVKVGLRCRPMSTNQINKNHECIVFVDPERGQVSVKNPKETGEKDRVFSFDMVFQPTCKQQNLFKQAALPIIQSVLQGYNGTIFAYGQTGTGKTHTMQGDKQIAEQRGVIPRTFQHIFKSIEGTPKLQFIVQASMLELYNQEIVDLLQNIKDKKDKLQLHQDPDKGVYVKGLVAHQIKTVEQMKQKLRMGSENRHTGSTEMNNVSSRSHSIFIIKVQMLEMFQNGESKIKAGRLNLVDLAGSQRQKKTQATGGRQQQGIHINLALSTLGQVIGALTNPSATHIPYRDSKLTRLLQDSLGGNTKTIMIANIGPSHYNYQQTMSTLRYAYQAKKIKNKPKINEDPKDALIRQYQQQIERLRQQLSGKIPGQTKIIEVQKRVIVSKQDKKRQVQAKLREEQEKIKRQAERQSKQMTQNLKNKARELQQTLAKKELQKQKEKEQQQKLVQQYKLMKQKMLKGDEMKEKARQHQKQLIKAQQQLEERKQQQRRLKQELEKKFNLQEQITNQATSIREQVDQKTKRLNQLIGKLKQAKQQTNQIHEFRTNEREQLQNQNRQLIKELKFINLLIENFIPIAEVRSFQTRLQFSDQVDDWIIKQGSGPNKPNPGSALGLKHPLCQFARMAISLGDDNPRFRPDNILKLDLDLPERTTQQLQVLEISEKISQTINIALHEDQEQQKTIANQKQPNVYIQDPHKMNKQQLLKQRQNNARSKSAKKMRPASGKKKKN